VVGSIFADESSQLVTFQLSTSSLSTSAIPIW